MSLVELSVNRISYIQSQNGAYALILEEVDGKRKLPIVIGGFEAQSIAIALDKEIEPPRPLTHDLFKNLADNYDIKIKQVIIHKLVDGIFFSTLICKRDNEEEIFANLHIKYKKKIPNLITIIIPRHIERTNDIAQMLEKKNLKFAKHSENKKNLNNYDVYVYV